MTDKLSGPELVEKTFVYMGSLVKECRKAVTLKFEREHKGIPFDTAEGILSKEVESWFGARDKNIKLNRTESRIGKAGEILITYSGANKDARFKLYVNGLFTLAGSSNNATSYLKNLNVNVDKRDFTR
ncbi:hypothetical protein MUP37_03640 [Candidatus Bathyarchaeota archaeon]|nr:hypothetical protein [Candidatus Bathyarchaeota archaeon]